MIERPAMRLNNCVAYALLLTALLPSLLLGAPSKSGKSSNVTINTVESEEVKPLLSPSEPSVGEQINWQVMAGGGSINGTSPSYNVGGTLGQTSIGPGSSLTLSVNQGFWQSFLTSGVSCISGDADESGNVDIDDVVYLIAYIFGGGPGPSPDICCGDADGSGGVDIDDVVYLIAFIFGGGPAPVDTC